MTRLLLLGLLLTGCQSGEPPAANRGAAAPKAAAPKAEDELAVAQRLVRTRLGNPPSLTFAEPRRTTSEGVPIVCGQYSQAGATHRYIVVGSEDVFVEPQMGAGEMDRAFTEFCGAERA